MSCVWKSVESVTFVCFVVVYFMITLMYGLGLGYEASGNGLGKKVLFTSLVAVLMGSEVADQTHFVNVPL